MGHLVWYNGFENKSYTREGTDMFITPIIPEQKLCGNIKENKRYEDGEKFIIGCQAIGGKPVAKISDETGMSREYIYQQKAKVCDYATGLDDSEPEVPTLRLDKNNIDRIILSLTFDCQSSNEGIARFFEAVIKEKTVSTGYISSVIAEAAKRAQAYDDQIDLSGISQGANDEIFQCGIPILVGVDPESTYAYLLEESNDRTAETWSIYLDDRKDHGLNLQTSINDGGAGLMAGIPQVFPDVEIQADTFHALYDMGKEISKLEGKAHKMIKNEQVLENNLAGKRPRAKNKEALEEIRPKVAEAVNLYDLLFILYTWFNELISFSGHSMAEALDLARWVLQEMDALAADTPSLRKEIAKALKSLPSLLSFLGRLERGMEAAAKEADLPVEGFRLMYRQLAYRTWSPQSNDLLYQQVLLLGKRYDEARYIFQCLLDRTKKASSLVENLNGRIRSFIEVKRIIPTNSFVLLKVYFNTRRYKRSSCKERIGKSPLELLTGTPQPSFLEALGY